MSQHRTSATTCSRTRRGKSCWGRRSSTWHRWIRSSRRLQPRFPVWGRRMRPRTHHRRCCRRCIHSCWDKTLLLLRVSDVLKIGASSLLLRCWRREKKDGGADSGEVDPSLTPLLSHSLCAEINPSSLVKRSKTAVYKSIKTLSQEFWALN